MTRAGLITLATMALLVFVPDGHAQEARVEERDYVVNTSECNLPTLTVARLCFEIKPGEGFVHVRLEETSPTAKLNLPIVALIRFTGAPSLNYDVCGSRLLEIVPGATGILVEVQQGARSGFCSDETQISPALKGNVTLTFN